MKRFLKIIAASVAIVMAFPTAAALAENAEAKGYNAHDLAVVQNFLEQEVDGRKNGVILYGEKYDVSDPETWIIDKTQYPGYWRPLNSGYQITPVFAFSSGGRLTAVNFGYNYYEEINGVHADGIRFFPVGGDFVFEGCSRLEKIYCQNNFNKVVITGASPKLSLQSYFGVYSSQICLPVLSGIGYASFNSEYSAIRIMSHYKIEDKEHTLRVTADDYANNDKSNPFVGWFNSITDELYSTESTIYIDAKELGKDFTCILEARYENSPEFTLETNSNTLPAGDVNGDMHINTGDAVEILKASVGYISSSYSEIVADVNKDGIVNTGDAVAILKLCAKV